MPRERAGGRQLVRLAQRPILRSVVERMLQPDPASRPTAAELVQQVCSLTRNPVPCCMRKDLLALMSGLLMSLGTFFLGSHARAERAQDALQVCAMQLPRDMQQQSPGTSGQPGAVPVTPHSGAHACTPVQHLLARNAGMAPPPCICIFANGSLCSHTALGIP